MKNVLLLLFSISLVMGACNSGDQKTETTTTETTTPITTDAVNNSNTGQEGAVITGPLAKIQFDKYEHDFGKVIEGETVEHRFVFTNTGENDLILSDARGSCGCTVPQWPRDPIKPGGKAEIVVSFNSTGRSGVQNKTVTITANTEPNITTINLRSEVVPKN